jgi:hypothetical protein
MLVYCEAGADYLSPQMLMALDSASCTMWFFGSLSVYSAAAEFRDDPFFKEIETKVKNKKNIELMIGQAKDNYDYKDFIVCSYEDSTKENINKFICSRKGDPDHKQRIFQLVPQKPGKNYLRIFSCTKNCMGSNINIIRETDLGEGTDDPKYQSDWRRYYKKCNG